MMCRKSCTPSARPWWRPHGSGRSIAVPGALCAGWLGLLLCLTGAYAGSRVTTNFTSAYQSTNVAIGDTIALSVRQRALIKAYGDTFPDAGHAYSGGPDIMVLGPNKFCYVWSDATTSNGARAVYRREVWLNDITYERKDTVRLGDQLGSAVNYLHADQGASRFLVSLYDAARYKLRVFNGTRRDTLVKNNYPAGSQCHFSVDTFLVSHQVNSAGVVLKKVYSGASPIAAADSVTVATSGGILTDAIFNSCVAVDSNRLVLVLWMHGGAADANRSVEFKLLDAMWATLDSGQVTTGAGNPLVRSAYDDIPVVSYAPGKFVAATWDASGVVLHRLSWSGSDVAVQSIRIVSVPGARHCSVARNSSSVLVSWKGDFNADGRASVEGFIYSVQGGVLSPGPVDTLCLSDASLAVPTTEATPELNVALDSIGNLGAVWPEASRIRGCLWASRGVLFTNGSWMSAVDSVGAVAPDSVWFYGDSVTVMRAALGQVYDSVRLGASSNPATPGAWTPWVSFDDAAGLSQTARGMQRFFQYKVAITRTVADSLRSPVVRGMRVYWDTKPSIDGIDSVQVRSVRSGPVAFGDTVDCFSRLDSVGFYVAVHDSDAGDTVSFTALLDEAKPLTLTGARAYRRWSLFDPLTVSDTVFTLGLSAADARAWGAVARWVSVRTRNHVPVMSVVAIRDTGGAPDLDTVPIVGQVPFDMQEGDSVAFVFSVSDTNDPTIRARVSLNGVRVDSVTVGATRRYVYHAPHSGGYGSNTVLFSATDPDTAVQSSALLVVNHTPEIVDLQLNGVSASDGDSVRVVLGSPMMVAVSVDDSDMFYWDTMSYHYSTHRIDSVKAVGSMTFVPTLQDSSVQIVVGDIFGASDTITVYLKHPWFAVDSASNPGYFAAKDTLAGYLSLLVGNPARDTVLAPLRNTGNDTMSITSLHFAGSDQRWFALGVQQGASVVLFDSLPASTAILPIRLAPGEQTVLRLYLNCVNLSGDGYVSDTLVVGTNDPAHPFDTVVVRLEHNDLPRIVQVSFDFKTDQPYWMAKSAANRTYQPYRFPPHARVKISFSEPIDSASVHGAVQAYSILDSAVRGSVSPITLTPSWNTALTQVTFAPRYTQPNLAFGGLLPTAGFFIPTDSVAFVVSSNITDRATTASGPNGLDVNLDHVRDTNRDTLVALRVDSVTYDLVQVSPDSGATEVGIATPIILTFNAPLFPGTIDTAKVANRSLVMVSRFHPTQQISFRSIDVQGATVTFRPARPFFFADSVYCLYQSFTGRDERGYPIDLNGDGIPATLFDSTATGDNKRWAFATENNVRSAVSPAPGDTGVSPTTPVILTFSSAVYPGTIDTSLTNNRSLSLRSRASGGQPIDFDSVVVRSNQVRFYPGVRLYWNDSVGCRFGGLSTGDTAAFSVAGFVSTVDTIAWHFSVKTIRLVSVTPDSASVGSDVHASVTLRFSERMYPGTFDTDSLILNRSLSLVSTYSAGTPMPLRRITMSADSTRVTVYPDSVLFGKDSITCTFAGFPMAFRYDGSVDPYTVGSDRFAAYQWYFVTRDVGFYTYPNPYKPGVDSRHCGNPDAPCGIVFRNLHVLGKGRSRLMQIRILSMKGFPIYDTHKADADIVASDPRFSLSPQWKWDTRNQSGELVSSGLYFYVIADEKHSVLTKGKLLIVR